MANFRALQMDIRQRERLHQSLPVLDIEYLPELRQKPQPRQQKKRRQLEDEALTYIISAFYAKLLVIIGIAFSITRSITTGGSEQHDIYFIYLYAGSILFFLYMYAVHLRTKSLIYEIYRDSHELMEMYKKNSYARYGSFYFRLGVVGFGLGSFIYATLQFGQYFEFNNNEGCPTSIRAIKPAARSSFILLQMLFIFSLSNYLDVQKSQLVSKFGLMHLVATNVSDWFHVLIESTIKDLFYSVTVRHSHKHIHISSSRNITLALEENRLLQITRIQYEQKQNCIKSNLITSTLAKLEPHLASCAVEYNLLCAMILVLIWKNSTSNKKEEASRDLSAEISRQSDSNVIYGRSQSQFSVDCAQTQRGLFAGILLLAVTIISLIMFFELIPVEDKIEIALLQVNIWEGTLYLTATIAVLFSFLALRDVKINVTNTDLKLEHLLLMITQYGVFFYFLFLLIGGCMMETDFDLNGVMRILTPLIALIQSSSQTAFILDAWRRRCSNAEHIHRKPGRQLITFLLLINISLWVVNRVKNNRSAFHPNQMDFYGILAWNIITHVSMPLVVSYRFQATVCFYEIWKHVYKRPIKPDLRAQQSESLT
ncbi:unnamed protein product [Phyllotreta striolata]|uniref:Uncharacterized protein n=1 Tax=Phyllotreta striolata TaxID=444603 RepID=A0A9N9TI79_PHYSR|nr:unnamed protein product [Phyllotreta striolata]